MRHRFGALTVFVTVLGSACIAHRADESATLRRLSKNGCNARLELVRVMPDTLDRRTACVVATAALQFVGTGGARKLGVVPTDTTVLTRYTVASFDMSYPDSKPVQRYWLVEFSLPTKTRSLAVKIDRLNGSADAKFSEPFADPR
jgi:hypothetical protein